ncbi:MAG: hypothetical protein LC115_05475, partial [Bacteroidia bacterium]|nr:hypothetical protein [Bacteroidia bacterium]
AKHEEQNYAAGVMSLNGSRLAVRRGLEALIFNIAQKFDRSTNVQFTTVAPLAASRCWQQ